MEENEVVADVKEPEVETQDVKQESVESEDVKETSIPYFRFKEVMKEKKSLETKLSKMKKVEDTRRQEKLKEDGEFKQLLEETELKLATSTQKASQWDEYQAQKRESLLSELSEDDQIIYGELPLLKLEAHVDKIRSTPTARVESGKPGVSKALPTKLSEMSMDEKRDNWPRIVDNFRRGQRSN